MLKSIEQLKSKDGVNLNQLQPLTDHLSSSGIDITNPAPLGKEYFLKSIKIPFRIHSTNLEERFTFLIFQKSEIFALYGSVYIKGIATQYLGVVAEEECIQEWSSFKQFLKDNYKKQKNKDEMQFLILYHSTIENLLII